MKDVNYNADMSKEMIKDVRDLVISSFESFSKECLVATFIKKEMVKKYKGVWHCIVGKNFGSFVTHEMKGYIYLTFGEVAVLLWKTVS